MQTLPLDNSEGERNQGTGNVLAAKLVNYWLHFNSFLIYAELWKVPYLFEVSLSSPTINILRNFYDFTSLLQLNNIQNQFRRMHHPSLRVPIELSNYCNERTNFVTSYQDKYDLSKSNFYSCQWGLSKHRLDI